MDKSDVFLQQKLLIGDGLKPLRLMGKMLGVQFSNTAKKKKKHGLEA